mmetsp:Transcript_81073/g.178043  ORF Transcript_81073/g.178043 Transcript_81073/m.178043 type:complete len:898 (-) Transcript_81073:150-2843(-)
MVVRHNGLAKQVGPLGVSYNRANYKYDQTMRWQRFTTGRKMAMSQAGMFRQDVTDLAGASMQKLKVYGPIYGIIITVCITTFVEGRSSLKFAGPPVFISQIYLQCLALSMAYISLAIWMLFHAAMRAQVACVQLRTRAVRLPVPTQKQLDASRKLLSTFEEQGVYDIARLPFMMPNSGGTPEDSEEEDDGPVHKGYAKGGLPGAVAKATRMAVDAHKKGYTSYNMRMPGFTAGAPSWCETEMDERAEFPASSPSGAAPLDPGAPFEHFEIMRQAQKDWWACEAYMRVNFLFGMLNLMMSFSYWIVLHTIGELGMLWCSVMGAAGLSAANWIIFRIDVLPEHGGAFPVEFGGPFLTSITLAMMYGHTVNQTLIDIARVVAAFIIILHIAMTYRMYAIAKPTKGRPSHEAKEAGGRLFNDSGACEHPSWLPIAFQHVMYLVAPPKTQQQLRDEASGRTVQLDDADPLSKVDLAPWKYTKCMLLAAGIGWLLQLGGFAVETVVGERMLLSNPGQPPWTRAGQWYGWEHGPISSKHYSHVTPQRGHWAWQRGWGPQGQQELWASDMFGFHPEADSWWSETTGPAPLTSAAGLGENTWSHGTLSYGQGEPAWRDTPSADTHDFLGSGGHRRLQAGRVPVPLPVQFPNLLEADLLACDAEGSMAVISSTGFGAVWSNEETAARRFELDGLVGFGTAKSFAFGSQNSLLVVVNRGRVLRCESPLSGVQSGEEAVCDCQVAAVAPLPLEADSAAVSIREVNSTSTRLRAAMTRGRELLLLELKEVADDIELPAWREVSSIPLTTKVQSISLTSTMLLAVSPAGEEQFWRLNPSTGLPRSKTPKTAKWESDAKPNDPRMQSRNYHSACLLPQSEVVHLASRWRKASSSSSSSSNAIGDVLKVELLV